MLLLVVAAVALGLVSMRLGRSANETIIRQHPLALEQVTAVSGETESGLGLWAAYGHFADGQHMYVPVTPTVAAIERGEPSPVPAPPVASVEPRGDWRTLVQQYDWPIGEAVRIVLCESSGNPSAQNGTSIGLFQVNTAAHPYTVSQMLDPVQNIAAAYAIWRDQGWGPWSCRP